GRYDPDDAAAVTRIIRGEAGLEDSLRRVRAVYDRVIADWERGPRPDRMAEARAVASYLRSVSPAVQDGLAQPLLRERELQRAETESCRRDLEKAVADAAAVRTQMEL